MKESEYSNEVLRKLREFENLGNIQPSPDWGMLLDKRLALLKPHSGPSFSGAKLAAVMLILLLINLGFILNTLRHDSNQNLSRISDLQVISNELFVNTVNVK